MHRQPWPWRAAAGPGGRAATVRRPARTVSRPVRPACGHPWSGAEWRGRDGLVSRGRRAALPARPQARGCAGVIKGLSWTDRLLFVWILGAMVIGVVCGKFVPGLSDRFAVAGLLGTPLPIAVGLWLMMWPVLAKVRAAPQPRAGVAVPWAASRRGAYAFNTLETA